MGSRCVMLRIQCVSRLLPMAALNASRTSVALGFVVRILFRNRVGWSVRGPCSVPTLSGPCPVSVSRPCLSVYAVFHPCFNVKVCGCCLCSTLCSHTASLVPFLCSVDAVFLMAWFIRYISLGAMCFVAVHCVRVWMCDSTVPEQWGQSAPMTPPSACVSFRGFLSCLVGSLLSMTLVRKIRR